MFRISQIGIDKCVCEQFKMARAYQLSCKTSGGETAHGPKRAYPGTLPAMAVHEASQSMQVGYYCSRTKLSIYFCLDGCPSWGRFSGVQTGTPTNKRIACGPAPMSKMLDKGMHFVACASGCEHLSSFPHRQRGRARIGRFYVFDYRQLSIIRMAEENNVRYHL